MAGLGVLAAFLAVTLGLAQLAYSFGVGQAASALDARDRAETQLADAEQARELAENQASEAEVRASQAEAALEAIAGRDPSEDQDTPPEAPTGQPTSGPPAEPSPSPSGGLIYDPAGSIYAGQQIRLVSGGTKWDLDNLMEDDSDVEFDILANGSLYFNPEQGAEGVIVTRDEVEQGAAGCRAATGYSGGAKGYSRIRLAGGYICVRTTAGNLALVHFTDIEDPNGQILVITLWPAEE